jgi:hypothetical protein
MPKSPPNFRPLPQSVADALVRALASMPTPERLRPRRFPAPWTYDDTGSSFVVSYAAGRALCYLYYEEEPTRRDVVKCLSREEARRIAKAIARLPELITAEKERGAS